MRRSHHDAQEFELENVRWRIRVPTGRSATDIGGSAPPLVVIGERGTDGEEVEFLPIELHSPAPAITGGCGMRIWRAAANAIVNLQKARIAQLAAST